MGCRTDELTLDLNCRLLADREKSLDDYAVLDVHAKYKLGRGFFTLAVDNVLDKEVQTAGDLSEDASSRYVYYEVGRLVKVGYEIAF
jgi:vitamin B12 transporter